VLLRRSGSRRRLLEKYRFATLDRLMNLSRLGNKCLADQRYRSSKARRNRTGLLPRFAAEADGRLH
jgi:outer membrane protein TolC